MKKSILLLSGILLIVSSTNSFVIGQSISGFTDIWFNTYLNVNGSFSRGIIDNNSIIVAGSYWPTEPSGCNDQLITKIRPDGTKEWQFVRSPGWDHDAYGAVGLLQNGNYVFFGQQNAQGTLYFDAFWTVFDKNGSEIKYGNFPISGSSSGSDMKMLSNHNIVFTGNHGNGLIFVALTNQDLQQISYQTFNLGGWGVAQLAIDTMNNLIFAIGSAAGLNDIQIRKYDFSLNLLGSYVISRSGSSGNMDVHIIDGCLYLCGGTIINSTAYGTIYKMDYSGNIIDSFTDPMASEYTAITGYQNIVIVAKKNLNNPSALSSEIKVYLGDGIFGTVHQLNINNNKPLIPNDLLINGKMIYAIGRQGGFPAVSKISISSINDLSTDSLNVVSGKSFSYPINSAYIDPSDSIDSYQFDLAYDTTKLEYSDFSTANTLSSNGVGQVNNSIKGRLKVGFIDKGYMNGSGELLKLYFKAINSGETTPVISDFLYNTDSIKNISNGTISIFTRYGDADGNDYIQAYDAALALKNSVGLDPMPTIDPIPWTSWRIEASDVDGNDTLTANDAGLILQRSIDLISSFPAEGLNAILRSASANVPDVTITKEGNNLVFKSYEDLIGLNVSLIDNYSALGTPVVLDNNFMKATNINESTYKIGLATATPPADGSTIMTIPIIDPTASEITIKMYVNTTEKIIRANIATGLISEMDDMIQVYPNPIKDILTIDLGSMTNCSLRITNILGQTVYSSQVHSQKMDINMSKIASSGLYYLLVIDNQKNVIATKKLLKK